MRAVIFIGSGKISYGKLAQALDHGALTVQIAGDFDDAMRRVQQVSRQLGIYLVNSVNPFRLEGQKTIMFRVLEALRWEVPDWIVVPGGNLGNVVALRQGVHRAAGAGPDRRAAAAGRHQRRRGRTRSTSSTRRTACAGTAGEPDQPNDRRLLSRRWTPSNRGRDTLASAIEINRPVNLPKALRALDRCGGVVREATDQEILDAKAKVGAGGLGCEPASAASVAGARKLRQRGRHRAGRARGLHPDRPSAEGPDGDGGVPQRRPEDVRRGARQARRPPGHLRQPRRAGAERPGRDHQGDRAVCVTGAVIKADVSGCMNRRGVIVSPSAGRSALIPSVRVRPAARLIAARLAIRQIIES